MRAFRFLDVSEERDSTISFMIIHSEQMCFNRALQIPVIELKLVRQRRHAKKDVKEGG